MINYCVNLLRRTKNNHFDNIKIISIADNKRFWKIVKSFLSDKISHKETINLVENGTIWRDDQIVADTFNNYFKNIVKHLLTVIKASLGKKTNGYNWNLLNLVEAAISKYKDHPSLNAIRGKMSELDNPNFPFEFTSLDQTFIELQKLARKGRKAKKACQVNDIAVKVIKENKDIVAFFVYHNFNNSLLSVSTFLTALKYADVKPVFKKDDKTDKENYKPISILPTLSNVYERFIYNKMYPYFDKPFLKL